MLESAKPETIAGMIMQSRRKFKGSYLLVEGKTDYKIYKSYIDNDTCIIQPTGGKGKAKEVIAFLERYKQANGVLACVDLDFETLNPQPRKENVLYTDVNNLETMIISSPAFDKVMERWGDPKKILLFEKRMGKELRSFLLECCQPVSFLKYLSNYNNLGIDFKMLDYDLFVNEKDLTINIDELIKIAGITTKTHFDIACLKTELSKLAAKNLNVWLVCCGHQLVRILSIAFRYLIGKNKTKGKTVLPFHILPSELENILHCSYESLYFAKTELCKNIIEWERKNSPHKILLPVFDKLIVDYIEMELDNATAEVAVAK
ncbi:DUF4435 domain-containing protein [Sporomusa sphaeroides]|uniref:DUF4435 domain-containing protein n=1 Tax=Sporomusa sphaeroides DSM 2875 TaxID=1337886 RepID=A0ABM9W8X9_9FIRM|nr:DUF4435 domain-containing protein [Sporomusa sphaeroides]OLS57641.1 hypothetical protein SPSPH_11570 [Sporomusa sphaeroides DSM 2875]CVK21334.1 hypothetical protein SSPH_04021 [Sporomusa sphaeroides DSM 2875]